MRRFLPLFLTALLTLPTLVALAATAPADAAYAQGSAAGSYASTAHKTTNARRSDHDLAKLRFNACLQRRAKQQARLMANHGELFHQDLRGVQSSCAMGWVGENVAVGYASGKAVVRAWMHSPGHRANILKSEYRLMGIAAVKRNGTWWVSQVFGTKSV